MGNADKLENRQLFTLKSTPGISTCRQRVLVLLEMPLALLKWIGMAAPKSTDLLIICNISFSALLWRGRLPARVGEA
jgi:hypothetical protein